MKPMDVDTHVALVDPVIELRDGLIARLPDRIRQIVMYGSYARGEAKEDSDIDVLVILRENDFAETERIRDVRYRVMEKHQYQPLISLLVLSEADWKKLPERSAGLKRNIEQEGITLWKQN